MRVETAEYNKLCRALTGKVHKLEAENKAINDKVRHLENDNAQMKSEIKKLGERLESMEQKTDDMEQKDLSFLLTLRCKVPPATEGGVVSMGEVKTFVKHKLKLDDDVTGKISIRKLGETEDSYVIKVDSNKSKGQLFKKCKQEKPADFYVSEFLTKKRHKLMYDLRQLKQSDNRIERIYSFNGNIFIKKFGTAEPILIRAVSDCNL